MRGNDHENLWMNMNFEEASGFQTQDDVIQHYDYMCAYILGFV